MQVAAEELVNVQPLAVEVRVERDTLFARGLQKSVDEKRAARELLDQQITRGLACDHVLALGHVLDEL